jgi:hypothetical protein
VAIQGNLIGHLFCDDLNEVPVKETLESGNGKEKEKLEASQIRVAKQVIFSKIHGAWTLFHISMDINMESMLLEPSAVNFWATLPDKFVTAPRSQWLMSNLSVRSGMANFCVFNFL